MKTLDEALAVFTKEEVVSFKWDKQVNPDTGRNKDKNVFGWGIMLFRVLFVPSLCLPLFTTMLYYRFRALHNFILRSSLL